MKKQEKASTITKQEIKIRSNKTFELKPIFKHLKRNPFTLHKHINKDIYNLIKKLTLTQPRKPIYNKHKVCIDTNMCKYKVEE